MAKQAMRGKRVPVRLIENQILATEECRWCSASGEPHSRACPLGERYRQVQRLVADNRPYFHDKAA